MKNKEFCNNFSYDFSTDIAAQYDHFARKFQSEYNKSHPDDHIWRHALYRRTFSFFDKGRPLSVIIEVVRFLHAGANKTFTYYAGLFLPFYRFSLEFMRFAAAHPDSDPALDVSANTLKRWEGVLSGASPHNPAYSIPQEPRP